MKDRLANAARRTYGFVDRHRTPLFMAATAIVVGAAYRSQAQAFNEYIEDRELGADFESWFDTK
jgi:hypothetical protein